MSLVVLVNEEADGKTAEEDSLGNIVLETHQFVDTELAEVDRG